MSKKIEVPTPEKLAKALQEMGEELPTTKQTELEDKAVSLVYSRSTYRWTAWLASWLVCGAPYIVGSLFSAIGFAGSTGLVALLSFFCLIVRGAIEFLDYCDGTSGQGRKFQDSLNILGDMMRDLAVARTSESLIPGKFLELFSSDAGLLHLYYDKWKTVMLTGDANERSSLEKAVADIEENIRQLVGSGVALDPDVREREIANFRSLLEKLTKRLGTVKSEETLRGDSVDEQIAKHVVEYMTREERPLLRSDEDGAETVANLELAPHLDGPLPDLSTPDDRDEARLDGRTRTRS